MTIDEAITELEQRLEALSQPPHAAPRGEDGRINLMEWLTSESAPPIDLQSPRDLEGAAFAQRALNHLLDQLRDAKQRGLTYDQLVDECEARGEVAES